MSKGNGGSRGTGNRIGSSDIGPSGDRKGDIGGQRLAAKRFDVARRMSQEAWRHENAGGQGDQGAKDSPKSSILPFFMRMGRN